MTQGTKTAVTAVNPPAAMPVEDGAVIKNREEQNAAREVIRKAFIEFYANNPKASKKDAKDAAADMTDGTSAREVYQEELANAALAIGAKVKTLRETLGWVPNEKMASPKPEVFKHLGGYKEQGWPFNARQFADAILMSTATESDIVKSASRIFKSKAK